VKGDLHDIGKNLVAMMLESGGMDLHDMGVDIPPEEFVSKIKESSAKIAERLSLGKVPCWKQRKRLEESGFTDGY
jgi:5-methyltetrahydrofolate--homocysteine methyltransferase